MKKLAFLLVFLLCGACHADTLQELLSGPNAVPASVKARDLNREWSVLSTQTPMQNVMQRLINRAGGQEQSNGAYYTRGQHVEIAGEEYLVAYRAQDETQPNDLQRRAARLTWPKDLPLPSGKLPENATLSLNLLHVKELGSLHNIHTFDAKTDLLTVAEIKREEEQQSSAMSMSNLKQVSLGVVQYVQDYDEKLPIMRGAKSEAELQNFSRRSSTASTQLTWQEAIMPYVKNTDVFVHPLTRRPYLANPNLSKRDLSSFEQPSSVVLLYEDSIDLEGKRAVAFLDGHVERVASAGATISATFPTSLYPRARRVHPKTPPRACLPGRCCLRREARPTPAARSWTNRVSTNSDWLNKAAA